MDYKRERRRGRGLLLALLGLVLLLDLLAGIFTPVLLWRQLQQPLTSAFLGFTLTAAFLDLLPTAVILWAIYRGSWPGLALMCISVIQSVGGLIGTLQFGGTGALNSNTALSAVLLLARVTLLLALFRHDDVSRYWSLQQAGRQRRDLAVEIIVFVLALLLSYSSGIIAGYIL